MNRQDIVPDWPATIGNFQSSNTRVVRHDFSHSFLIEF
jgi:hypothetical protein